MSSPAAVLLPADQRVADLLDAVRRAFADKGFDGASMQDLAREAGMSVGNFYRYFPSKTAIVDALISRDLDEMQADFAQILTADDLRAALRAKIIRRLTATDCTEDGRLFAEITAAAMRRSDIGAALQKMEAGIIDNMSAVIARMKRIPADTARAIYGAHAAFIVLLVKTAIIQPERPPQIRDRLNDFILRSIDRTLDEIEADLPERS